MQLGFVIDHSRCIGCHACTVACKSENDVPLGSFRTWVKYTEEGQFPAVKRNFSVLRCNQCTDAPCMTICPTGALSKRDDGIVDVDPKACIGCKSCMHACPYDALYINDDTGTAEKCHFCAHRTERGLAPACAVVCPTEAIIPGDFDDPNSRVSQMKATGELTARKVEAGTKPNVLYREAAAVGLDPGRTNISEGFIWSNAPTGERADAQAWEALEARAHADSTNGQARTTYDVPREQLWGWKITGYLFTKSISAGAVPAAALAFLLTGQTAVASRALFGLPTLVALAFLALTSLLLITDLKRPERFWYILARPNWDSWLAKGTLALTAYGGLLSLGALGWLLGLDNPIVASAYSLLGLLTGAATAGYTAFLFAQAKGRVLWMKRLYAPHLLAQGIVGGGAAVLMAAPVLDWNPEAIGGLRTVLALGLGVHFALTLAEPKLAPKGRESEYARASHLLTHGPYAVHHWALGIGAGVVLPVVLLVLGPASVWPVAAAIALAGLWVEEDLFVRAGQALPIS
ncbi:4Fe-4S dicluster domain-containing protein [Engelhardtia mirabilis]|uniref:Tetrathionate reductase subunit B n=1 Tax=Engelhardtia mirabilis TaxID=2528011 RepID=A0A518BET8_9BACT|nr:Tetrathionate reductase subunit B precursor [Planctomycetes bacterium Pla133]QDU99729.1 Tetrathionate reductase subunit B precursor [Planctomycetes bacterium Pla86]